MLAKIWQLQHKNASNSAFFVQSDSYDDRLFCTRGKYIISWHECYFQWTFATTTRQTSRGIYPRPVWLCFPCRYPLGHPHVLVNHLHYSIIFLQYNERRKPSLCSKCFPMFISTYTSSIESWKCSLHSSVCMNLIASQGRQLRLYRASFCVSLYICLIYVVFLQNISFIFMHKMVPLFAIIS